MKEEAILSYAITDENGNKTKITLSQTTKSN